MFKCTNCVWEGEELSKINVSPIFGKCPLCGDDVKKLIEDTPVVEPVKVEPVKVPEVAVERIKDFTDDLLDDGKRNYSNRKKK